jgi:dienelactone hydrolase
MSSLEKLKVAGVPLLLGSPNNPNRHTPLILFWHGFGSPSCEADIAEAFPLEQLEVCKAYLGLPLFGQRSIGAKDLMRRQFDDYVLQLLLPVIDRAMQELPSVVEGLRSHCDLDSNSPLGLFGFSAGGLAALLTLTESQLPIQATVLVGVTKDLPSAVETYEKFTRSNYEMLKAQYPELKPEYIWSEESQAVKTRLDFVTLSKKIAQREPIPAILVMHSVRDEAFDLQDAEILYNALKAQYEQSNHVEKISMKVFQHLKHAIDLAANSSPEQRADIFEMEKDTAEWFEQYL